MSSVTTTTFPTTLAYYGAGIIGFFTLASFGMKKIFGCFRWIPFSRNDLPTNVIQDLRQTLSQRDAEIVELRGSLSTAENRSTKTARELEASRKEIEHVNRTRTDLEKRAREALIGKEALEHQLDTRAEELATSREDASTIKEALNHAKTLLDMRTAELKVAQAFLPRSDRYAGADIMKMVESLNSEIHQTASIMADVFSPDLQGPGTVLVDGEVGLHEAAVHTEEILGEGMTKMLQTFNHQEENILLQIAFQASMCAFTEWIMDSWCYHDRDSEVEAVLQETYEQLRETDIFGYRLLEKVHGEEGTWDNTVLLKPKIVMPSGLTASPTSSESPDWTTHSIHGEQEEL
ncbi:hypothetical protein F5876DRAFT_68613 [Lentinula aff. lateritia]|uniref:Uncharacterized protein n=1 Tax=Lentinula aff. lateritia TaxID=2804960 RepID=A0ACC1TQ49_9AGAR|nr:hypothetical protein F5876DRAFT_68613 [Lentinula aff. lateritia]